MTRALPLLLLLGLSACRHTGFSSVPEAEQHALAQGLQLTDKRDATGVLFSVPTYTYKANGTVPLSIAQFDSRRDAARWMELSAYARLPDVTLVRRGAVIFAIKGPHDPEHQSVIQALR